MARPLKKLLFFFYAGSLSQVEGMSEDESKQRFAAADTDNSGGLSPGEAETAGADLIIQFFAGLDADEDGGVTLQGSGLEKKILATNICFK